MKHPDGPVGVDEDGTIIMSDPPKAEPAPVPAEEHHEALEHIISMREQRDAIAVALCRVEWDRNGVCSCCGEHGSDGHKEACAVHQALTAAGIGSAARESVRNQ